MKSVIYLGDEVEAAGFRLAGVDARVLQSGTEQAAFARAREEAAVLLIGESWAGRLPLGPSGEAGGSVEPLLLVVGASDLAGRIRSLLGRVS